MCMCDYEPAEEAKFKIRTRLSFAPLPSHTTNHVALRKVILNALTDCFLKMLSSLETSSYLGQ